MNYLSPFMAFSRVKQAMEYNADRLRRLQWRRARRLVKEAYRTIPYYRERLDAVGIRPEELRSLSDIDRLPVITKAELQAADPASLISRRYSLSQLHREQTTGSSGRPFVMHFDRGYIRIRRALFLRALMSCGYRPGHRLLFATSQDKAGAPAWMGWRYLNHNDSPLHNVQQHNALRPHFVYGWVTPIRQMAEAARAKRIQLHQPRALITTAEKLDPPTRRLLEQRFNCPVYEIYGLTETGALAWQSPAHRHFAVSHDSMIVEFLPAPDGGRAKRLVVTNLGLRSMPFIRYDTGDLARPVHDGNPGALPAIERVEGRQVDCVHLDDGRVISPYELTTAMEDVPGVWRYQIVQDRLDRFTVRYEPQAGATVSAETTAGAAQQAMHSVLGTRVIVDMQSEATLDPPPGTKFRVVQSRLSQSQAQQGVGG